MLRIPFSQVTPFPQIMLSRLAMRDLPPKSEQNVLKYDLKKSRICPILRPRLFCAQIWHTWLNPAMWPQHRDVRFGSKVGQLFPEWEKFGTFSDQISIHFGSDWPHMGQDKPGSFSDQILVHFGSEWPQMGQFPDFFRSDYRTFWRKSPGLSHLGPICTILGSNVTFLEKKVKISVNKWKLVESCRKSRNHVVATLPLVTKHKAGCFILLD